MTAADLLRGERYQVNAGRYADQEPEAPPMGAPPSPDPSQGQQSYAALLAESRSAPPAEASPVEAPAQALAPQSGAQSEQPYQRPRPGTPEWMTPERKAMYEASKRAAQNYRSLVEARRTKRKVAAEYSKMYNQVQQAMGAKEDMDNLIKTYPHMFPPDDERTMAMKRQQLQHFEKVQRLDGQLREMLQRHGVKVGPKSPLPENPFGGSEEDDRHFDRQMYEGFADALTTPYQ